MAAHDHVTNSSRCVKRPISNRAATDASTIPSFNRASFFLLIQRVRIARNAERCTS